MQEITVIKGPNNSLHPATEEDAARIARYKLGQGVILLRPGECPRNRHRRLDGADASHQRIDPGPQMRPVLGLCGHDIEDGHACKASMARRLAKPLRYRFGKRPVTI